MTEGSSWQVLVATLPAIAGLLKVVWPTGERGLHRAIRRSLETLESMPEGPGKDALVQLVNDLGQEIRYTEAVKARRRWSPSGIGTAVLVVLAGGGGAFGLWQIDFWLTKILAVLLIAFSVALILGGVNSIRETAESFRFEERSQSSS